MSAAYRIVDEPRPGALANLAVNPLWPLLSVMFGGAWCAWPWFVINAFAVGSPTRVRETVFAILGFAGVIAIAMVAGWMLTARILAIEQVKYVLLVVTLWKLGVSYWLFELQGRSFGLYQYFGGTVRSGVAVTILAALARPYVIGFSASGWWKLLVT